MVKTVLRHKWRKHPDGSGCDVCIRSGCGLMRREGMGDHSRWDYLRVGSGEWTVNIKRMKCNEVQSGR